MFAKFIVKHRTQTKNKKGKVLSILLRTAVLFFHHLSDDLVLNIAIRNGKSQETRAVLLIFSLELEISGVAVQRIHQNGEK